MIVNSYFSGAGLFDIGLLNAGININKSFEIDQACCRVQRKNFAHETIESDLKDKIVGTDNECDVMLFTYPCTKYSNIADIHGTRTGDELFLHAFRHMAIGSPEVFVVENVMGMRAFPVVMEAMTKLPTYYITTFCPINSNIWLPQNRQRLIIIGTKKPFNFREPAQGRTSKLSEILEENPRVTLPKAIKARMTGKYRDLPIISDPSKGDIAPTCVAHYAKDKSTRLVVDQRYPMGVRPYSVREFARLQGVPDWFDFDCSDTDAYKMIGNGVSVPLGEWVGNEIRRYFGRKPQRVII